MSGTDTDVDYGTCLTINSCDTAPLKFTLCQSCLHHTGILILFAVNGDYDTNMLCCSVHSRPNSIGAGGIRVDAEAHLSSKCLAVVGIVGLAVAIIILCGLGHMRYLTGGSIGVILNHNALLAGQDLLFCLKHGAAMVGLVHAYAILGYRILCHVIFIGKGCFERDFLTGNSDILDGNDGFVLIRRIDLQRRHHGDQDAGAQNDSDHRRHLSVLDKHEHHTCDDRCTQQ